MTEVDTMGAIAASRDEKTGEILLVYPPGTDLAMVRKALPDGYRLETAEMTVDEVEALQAQIRKVASGLGKGGYAGIGYTADDGKVTIATNEPEVFKQFRDDPRVAIKTDETGGRLGRTNDPAPHKGGAVLLGPCPGAANYTCQCTSGFTVKKPSGTKYMVTAGHCYNLTKDVEGGTGLDWGTVVYRASFPSKDMELIHGSTYQGQFYRGGATGTIENVHSAGDPVAGNTYCVSGASSLATHCAYFMETTNDSFCDVDGCTTNLARANGFGVEGGDSGGPWFINIDGLFRARGITIAKVSEKAWLHKWSTISSTFDVTIVAP